MAAKDDLGRAGEARAARYLETIGCTIVDRNWRCRDGELDLVATTPTTLLIVEVKARRSAGFGHPLEAIDPVKQKRLWRLGMAWIAQHRDVVQGRRLQFAAIGLTGPDPATAALDFVPDLELR